ncbi:MAG: CinA family protein [Alphaproteobacteria bacterium]|nr:CinA family protein [Alphaproteobacteria bacterium]
MAFPDYLLTQAAQLLAICRQKSLMLALAESCSGGLIAALLTEIPGSSDVIDRGFVTYSNRAKMEMLGVPPLLLETYGAVSREAAIAMAEGGLNHSQAHYCIAVTGIAGPTGDTPHKPIGTVHLAIASRQMPTIHQACLFQGDRSLVRLATVEKAIGMIAELVH